MASNTNRSLMNPRDKDGPQVTPSVDSQNAGVCGDFEYPLYPLALFHDAIDPTCLGVFRGNSDTYESMSLGGFPDHPWAASAEGAQGVRGSDYIDLTQPALSPCPMAEPPTATQERDANSVLGPQSREDGPHRTLMCEWRDCNRKRPFRREAELVRHIMTIHVRPNAYGCPVDGCSGVFNRKDNLKVHLQKKH